ncbi:uncharacterized protein DEA37_0007786, partial [Paragonimus westermani]
MITDMLEKRIIRPSVSLWSSPTVLVRKKNGTLRLCVDYRKLNEITDKDSFPIPRIDATLDALHGAQWFSALDLASGYWKVEYRKFIQGFAEIATPLHRLTGKGHSFTWSDKCNASFETLKEKLTTPPILAFPDISDGAGKFVLDTDASNVSIGAVLSQETPEVEVVIAYTSRCLDKCERNYSTIHFLKHFRAHLLGKPFKYRRESRRENAKALSRVTVPNEVNTTLLYDADTLWAEDQLSGSYIVNIYKRQADGSSKPSAVEMRQKPFDERALWGHWKDLRLIDGVLYRMDQSGPKLVSPRLKVAAVLQKIHTESGHAGRLITEAAIRQRYWWPGIHADV